MSNCFRYAAADYKIVSHIRQYRLFTNRRSKIVKLVSFQRDEFEQKNAVLPLTGEGRIEMDVMYLSNLKSHRWQCKDLGIIVNENLTQTKHGENHRGCKATRASYLLKMNIVYNTQLAIKRNR